MSLRQVSSYKLTAHLYRLLTTCTSVFPTDLCVCVCVCSQIHYEMTTLVSFKPLRSLDVLKLHRLVLQLPTGGLLELSVAPMNQVSTCFTFWLEHTHIRSTEQQDGCFHSAAQNCRVTVHLTFGLIDQSSRKEEIKVKCKNGLPSPRTARPSQIHY